MEKKKIIAISLIILIIIIFISAYIFIRNRLTIKAIVIECHENSILVYEEKNKALTSISLPKNINLKFKPGQEVIIYLSANTFITQTYPASIDSIFIKKIKIIKDDGNTQIVERLLQQRLLREKNH